MAAPELRGALLSARAAGHAHVTVDGTLVRTDRCHAPGPTARFTVTQVQQYPKDAFLTAEVYGPTAGAELRLITCGGAFDRTQRSYVDNVVVYARLAS
jgi:hypothetical protein